MSHEPTPTFDLGAEPSFVARFLIFHQALRRDLLRLPTALAHAPGEPARIAALRDLWSVLPAMLRGHHHFEDRVLFPGLVRREPALAAVVGELEREHAALDPLLASLDAAIEALPTATAPVGVADAEALAALLERHLAAEEVHLVPVLRTAPPSRPPAPGPADPRAMGWIVAELPPEHVEIVAQELSPEDRVALGGWGADHVRRTAACFAG